MASNLSSLRAEMSATEERADEAEEEAEDVRDDLEDTEDALEKATRSLRNARSGDADAAQAASLGEQLASGTATPTQGLSVSRPRRFWKCTQWRGNDCFALRDEAVFKNDTQIGSAVTCLFEVTYEDGATTTFSWTADYVPPGGGTDTQVIYFYSDYSSPLDLLGERDCYRGSADYTSGVGE